MKHVKSIRKIFRSEFLTQFTAGKLVAIIISIMIPVTILLLRDKIVVTEKDLEQTKGILTPKQIIEFRSSVALTAPYLIQGISYTVLIRLFFIFKDKNTLDKNRLSFLKYNKHLVSFIKIFVDVLLFFIHVFLLMFLGIMITIYHLNGAFPDQEYYNLTKILISLTVFYIFTNYGVKLINSFFNNYFYKNVLLGLWLLLTAGYYLICSPMLLDDTFAKLYYDNVQWIIYIPFLHLLNSSIILYDVYYYDWVQLIPLLTITTLFMGITWSLFTTSFKEYLCA